MNSNMSVARRGRLTKEGNSVFGRVSVFRVARSTTEAAGPGGSLPTRRTRMVPIWYGAALNFRGRLSRGFSKCEAPMKLNEPMATQWEYRVRTVKIAQVPELERWLSSYGVAGWEVVSIST